VQVLKILQPPPTSCLSAPCVFVRRYSSPCSSFSVRPSLALLQNR
jgi:hypothetical protein